MSKNIITIADSGMRFKFCENGDLKQLRESFAPEVSIYLNDESDVGDLLHTAAYYGHTDIVKYLIETVKMDFNAISEEGNTPLYLAKLKNCKDTVEYLLSLNAKYMTPEEALKTLSMPHAEDYISFLFSHFASNQGYEGSSEDDDTVILGLSNLNLNDS